MIGNHAEIDLHTANNRDSGVGNLCMGRPGYAYSICLYSRNINFITACHCNFL